jgi:hypothetical protein
LRGKKEFPVMKFKLMHPHPRYLRGKKEFSARKFKLMHPPWYLRGKEEFPGMKIKPICPPFLTQHLTLMNLLVPTYW